MASQSLSVGFRGSGTSTSKASCRRRRGPLIYHRVAGGCMHVNIKEAMMSGPTPSRERKA
eukprot:8403091-Karenia_brevis.AAC.1